MHKLIHSLVLGAAHDSFHELLVMMPDPVKRAISDYTKALEEDLRAARLPQHVHPQHCDMCWGTIKLGIYPLFDAF